MVRCKRRTGHAKDKAMKRKRHLLQDRMMSWSKCQWGIMKKGSRQRGARKEEENHPHRECGQQQGRDPQQ